MSEELITALIYPVFILILVIVYSAHHLATRLIDHHYEMRSSAESEENDEN